MSSPDGLASEIATVRAQPAVALIPAFSTGVFVAGDDLDASAKVMLDQVIAWSGALRGVREAKSRTGAAA